MPLHDNKVITQSSNQVKTNDIGRAKDLAVDLQRRANELATSASNKMANIYGRFNFRMIIIKKNQQFVHHL